MGTGKGQEQEEPPREIRTNTAKAKQWAGRFVQ